MIPGGGVVEGGEAAARMQAEVREIALEHGVALLGPNCMGLVDWTTNAAVYIGDVSPWLPRGHVAGLAQSGSVTDAFIHSGTRIGFSRIVSVGAEVVLDLCDYLGYCLDDPETHAVILFVEGFKRPERFLALADRALELGKPILAVKVGRSAQAQAAAIAHSGSLAGEDRVTDAALGAAGVVRCADLDELLEAAELVAGIGRLGRRGVGRGRTGVVTVSTGEASLIADLAARAGLDLPPVPDAARDAILRDLPTMGYVGNPLDPWGADEAPVAYRAAFRALAESGAYDVLAIVHDSPYRELPSEVETAREVTTPLIEATAGRPDLLPVYVSLTAGEISHEIHATLAEAGGMPMLRGASEAIAAIAGRAWWEARRAERLAAGPRRPGWPALGADRVPWGADETADPLAAAAASAHLRRRPLPEHDSLARLAAAGVPVTPVRSVPAHPVAALEAWRELGGGPVAIKADAEGLAHKTEAGAVRLGLASERAIRDAVAGILEAVPRPGVRLRGLLVEPMAVPGVELIVGGRRDPVFGPAVLVGLGGVFAEVLDDVAVLLAPAEGAAVRDALGRLRGAALLRGARGRPGVDLDAVAALVVAVGDHLVANPEVVEIDLNPVMASAAGAVAVDALIVVEERAAP